MSRPLSDNVLRREILSAGPAAPGSRGRPGDSRFSLFDAMRDLAGGLANFLRAAFDILLDWQERSRQRQILLGLDDRMLRDIGLTRSEAEAEYRKPPWRG